MIKRGTILIALGCVLICAAAALSGYNLYEGRRAGSASRETVTYLTQVIPAPAAQTPETELLPPEETEIPDYLLDPSREMPVLHYNGNDYIGTLSIPALGLELPVISEWSYPALRVAPCRYTGSAYSGGLVIAAHNYKAHFGDLSALNAGDTITFTDTDGNCFSYKVAAKETLPPTAVEEMRAGDWPLTLFTCTVGGSYRVSVRCESASELN